ncbi:MAG: penicillin-binding protein [Kineosporiaceae bacterium]|nr:penicillin-binding protein [Kineosporiaceae bacterium]MBK7623938.1 penicillin-binding protein [Kineosporiaceae bacterium]
MRLPRPDDVPAARPGAGAREGSSRLPALLAAFLATSLVAGALVAGLLLPTVGAAGSFTRDAIGFYNSIPADLEDLPLPEGSTLYARDGKTPIATFYEENRVVTPLIRVAPIMQQAVVAIEDSRFYEHGGVDPKGLLRAMVSNKLNDGQVQGASTLTQQLVKNKLVESAVGEGDKEGVKAATARKNARKVKEIRMAIELEKTKSKGEILEGYLNIAAFGQNNYGVEAASQYFFKTTAARLTLPQAALLAGIVQSPESYNPFKHPKAAKNRRGQVLTRMADLKVISEAQRAAADKAPLPTTPQVAKAGCITAGASAYFCQYALQMLLTDPRYAVLGKTEDARESAIRRGGYKIVTTLDARLQKAATAALMKKIPPADDSGVATSAVTVQPGTGQVLSIAQNTNFNPQRGPGQTELNYGVDKVYGGAAGFQVGSTFKPFTLATWLSKGKGLFTNVTGDQQSWSGRDFSACGEPLGTPRFKVSNSEGSGPPSISVMQATFNSVNLAYMDMASRLDLCDITKTAEAMGVHLASPPTQAVADCYKDGTPVAGKLPTQCPAMILGALLISPLTMANAYATFAAEGTYCPPTPVLSVLDRSGKAQSIGATKCVSEAIPTNVARGVIYAGKRVFTEGTARGRGIRWPAAGKTGTTDNSVRTWFVGYTKQLATAVVVADPKDYPEARYAGGRSLNNRRIGGVGYGHVFGATIAAPLWQSIMTTGMDGLPREDWPAPPAKMLEGSGIKVAEVVGRTLGEATGILQGQGFKVRVGPPTASFIGPDRVAKSSPSAGGRLEKGSTVVIYPGDGSAAPPPGNEFPGGGDGFPGIGNGNGNNGNGFGRGRG